LETYKLQQKPVPQSLKQNHKYNTNILQTKKRVAITDSLANMTKVIVVRNLKMSRVS